MPDIEKILDTLVGPREEFRRALLDAPGILHRICRKADIEAKIRDCEPWYVISKWTSHGSGVSKAIYEMYRGDDHA